MKSFKLFCEAREGLLRYLRSRLPEVPSYVLYDFFYRWAKGLRSQKETTREDLELFINEYGKMKWILVKDFKIDPETTFDDETMRQIREREGGTKNPYGVQKDAERHAGAKERISSQGIPKEPIILIKKGDKYALAEGWHRTIQLLNLYPDGFTYPNVYVGISK